MTVTIFDLGPTEDTVLRAIDHALGVVANEGWRSRGAADFLVGLEHAVRDRGINVLELKVDHDGRRLDARYRSRVGDDREEFEKTFVDGEEVG